MDKKALDESYNSLENQLHIIVGKITRLNSQLAKVLEKNSELEIENEYLRSLLQSQNKNKESLNYNFVSGQVLVDNKNTQQGLSMSKQNLEKLYNQGFHICNQFYGKRRQENENCIFCTELIYG